MSVIALVLAAGRAGQLGSVSTPALRRVAGRPLLTHTLGNLAELGCVDLAVPVVPAGDRARTLAALGEPALPVQVVEAGQDDADDPVRAGLAAGLRQCPNATIVLVHRISHAFAPAEVMLRVIAAIRDGADSALPVLPCSDTVKRLNSAGVIIATPDRAGLRVAQAPSGFTVQRLRTGGAEIGPGARTVPGHPDARALRGALDLAIAEAMLVASA